MLVFTAIATVIFWRRSEDRMALFGAFMLVVFGGAALTSGDSTGPGSGTPYPVVPGPPARLPGAGGLRASSSTSSPTGGSCPAGRAGSPSRSRCCTYPTSSSRDRPSTSSVAPVYRFPGSLVVAQVYRYRWVSNPAERQQTKWVVSGVAVALVGFATLLILANFVLSPESMGPLAEMAGRNVRLRVIALIPLSIGVAILRSGLYEIDIIINRTLVYGSLTAMLVALYFGGMTCCCKGVFVALTGEQIHARGRGLHPRHSGPVQPLEATYPGVHRSALLQEEVRREEDPRSLLRQARGTRRTWRR